MDWLELNRRTFSSADDYFEWAKEFLKGVSGRIPKSYREILEAGLLRLGYDIDISSIIAFKALLQKPVTVEAFLASRYMLNGSPPAIIQVIRFLLWIKWWAFSGLLMVVQLVLYIIVPVGLQYLLSSLISVVVSPLSVILSFIMQFSMILESILPRERGQLRDVIPVELKIELFGMNIFDIWLLVYFLYFIKLWKLPHMYQRCLMTLILGQSFRMVLFCVTRYGSKEPDLPGMDNMFSGHTYTVTVVCLFANSNLHLLFVGAFLFSGYHYTADILVGLYVGYTMVWLIKYMNCKVDYTLYDVMADSTPMGMEPIGGGLFRKSPIGEVLFSTTIHDNSGEDTSDTSSEVPELIVHVDGFTSTIGGGPNTPPSFVCKGSFGYRSK